jgi:hypothetical protein
MNAHGFRFRDLVDERCGEERIEFQARRAAVAGATIRPALFADFFEVGVNRGREAGGAHAAISAFHVPNGN